MSNEGAFETSQTQELSVLVPLDGSKAAESVFPVLEYLSAALDLRVLLLHSIERHAPAHVHGEPHLQDPEAAERYLKTAAFRLEAKGARVTWHVHQDKVGDIAKSIIEHASEVSPDLVVMCTHGRGGLREALYGSVAQNVLHSGERSLLLIPSRIESRHEEYKLRRILFPVDGSHAFESALHLVSLLLQATKAEVNLLFVSPAPGDLSGEESLPGKFLFSASRAALEIERDNAAGYLEEVRRRLPDPALVAIKVRSGSPADEIHKEYIHDQADLLVMSTHGTKGLEAFLSRSVGARITSLVRCPILLTRPQES